MMINVLCMSVHWKYLNGTQCRRIGEGIWVALVFMNAEVSCLLLYYDECDVQVSALERFSGTQC